MSESAVSLCRGYGGVARSGLLRAAGATAAELASAVRDGTLVQPRRGLYAVPPVDPALGEALAHRGKLACVSAARRCGLWVLDAGPDGIPHVWTDPERHVAPVEGCRCVMHRDHRLPGGDISSVGIVHAVIQVAWCQGDEAFFVVFESALRQGILPDRDRSLIRERVPATMRWLVDFARADADSGLESLVRLRLHLLGIDGLTQVPIPGVGIVDFVLGDCLIVEADGRTHDGPNRHRDLVRDAAAMALGFVTLRFDSAMILHDWDLVQQAILAALGRGLHETTFGRSVRGT
jgi:very-short-patch-repair endonuclease